MRLNDPLGFRVDLQPSLCVIEGERRWKKNLQFTVKFTEGTKK